MKARDAWIGWAPEQQFRRLHLVANNTRFLILPGFSGGNLASRVLSLSLRRLSADMRAARGHPVLLAETFVDCQYRINTPQKYRLKSPRFGLPAREEGSAFVPCADPAALNDILCETHEGVFGRDNCVRFVRPLPRQPTYLRKADNEFEARLVAPSCSAPPEGHAHWSLQLLADRAVEFDYIDSVSHETVRRMKKSEIKPWRRIGWVIPPAAQRGLRGRDGAGAGRLLVSQTRKPIPARRGTCNVFKATEPLASRQAHDQGDRELKRLLSDIRCVTRH